MYSQMYFISVQADLFLLSHFMMYSGLKFLLAPVNEVGSLTKRNWKFLAVSFLPCGMTTIMYPDKGLVQAKGDVFILLTTNSEIDKMQFHCKKVVVAPVTMFLYFRRENCDFLLHTLVSLSSTIWSLLHNDQNDTECQNLHLCNKSSGLEWNAKTGGKETNEEGKQQHDAKALLSYKPKPSSLI